MKLLALDSNSIVNRAFYGIRPLTTRDGMHTNGIYGFINILYKFIKEENPDYIVAAFDLKQPTFRHNMYEQYKAGRHAMPEELVMQIPVLKEVLKSLNVCIIECAGYEADDIIGTVSDMCEKSGIECVIATGDRDSLQLVSDNTVVKLAVSKNTGAETIVYDTNAIKETYNVLPNQMIDIKAIMGDSSDNIPGVKGIGQKGAGELIEKFGSIEYIYDNLDSLDIKPAMKEKLKNSKDMAFLSKTLGTICKTVPLDAAIEDMRYTNPDYEKARELFSRLEFNAFIKKYLEDTSETDSSFKSHTQEAVQVEDISDFADKIEKSKQFYFISKDNTYKNLYCLYESKVYHISEQNSDYFTYRLKIGGIFENPLIEKFTHDAKPVILSLFNDSIGFENLAGDSALAGYVLNPSVSAYKAEDMILNTQKTAVTDKAGVCAYLKQLLTQLENQIQLIDGEFIYKQVELKLCPVLASMESAGFMIDKKMLEDYEQLLNSKESALENEIYELSGEKFNINSPKQLGVILFEKLSLPVIKKTKSGYATGAEVLEKLKGYHDIIDKILEYRTITKLNSTYAKGLKKVIGADNKVHTTFNQTVTATGRISSTEPNLQNIPIRLELGKEIRKMFVPSDSSYVLLDADYSQIELRVLADIADDSAMLEAFENNEDIHTKTASAVFKVDESGVTAEMRRAAKAVNFGIVYGISDFSLAGDIKTTKKKAAEYINNYLQTYSGVARYMDNIKLLAKQNGYVKTKFNRIRYIPEITSTNYNMRSFGERVALNAPIQGTAADIIKLAMVRVYEAMKKEKLKSRLILQVHDELLIEAKKDEKERVCHILKTEMEAAAQLKVKLKADVLEGDNWYDCH